MNTHGFTFLFALCYLSFVTAFIYFETSPTNATLQRSVSLICVTNERIVQFRKLPSSPIGIIAGAYLNGSCNFAGSYNTSYNYRCDKKDTYNVTIPGYLVTEQLHESKWLCQNPYDPLSYTVTQLFINIPISSIEIESISTKNNPVVIHQGTTQRFKCTANSGRPSSRIQWYISDMNLTSNATAQPDVCSTDCRDDKVISSSTLEYIGDIKNDGKYLFCTASNTKYMDIVRSQNISLVIYYGPQEVKLNPVIQLYNVNETGSVGPISCTAECNPRCYLTWIGPGNFTNNNSIFNVQHISRHQAGKYYCRATHMLGDKISSKVDIVVNYGPNLITLSPSIQSYLINETESVGPISCSADCKPGCKITWTGPNRFTATTDKLNLQNITRNQAGGYQCKAENYLGYMVSSKVIIAVHYPCECPSVSQNADAILTAGVSSLIIGILMILITIVVNCFMQRSRSVKKNTTRYLKKTAIC